MTISKPRRSVNHFAAAMMESTFLDEEKEASRELSCVTSGKEVRLGSPTHM